MAYDFRDGKTFPRRGREALGGYYWLARVIDKGRASAAGTIHDYIYPCHMDCGVFERWGITTVQFDELLRRQDNDDDIVRWLDERVSAAQRDAANNWVLREKAANLDRQDAEEGIRTTA